MPKPSAPKATPKKATTDDRKAQYVAARLTGKGAPKPVVITSERLDGLLEERMMVAAKLAQLDAKKKELDRDILALTLRKSGAPNGAVDTGKFTVRITNAQSTFTDPTELLKLGVKASVIEKATRHTPYSYPRISRKTQVPAGDEGEE